MSSSTPPTHPPPPPHTPQPSLTIRFWGVRGSIASPGPDTIRYGGNTACVEVRAGDQLLVLDGGTGLRRLGAHLLSLRVPSEAHIFLSHLHWDHIQGIPFFTPAFIPGNRVRFYGERKGSQGLQEILEAQMHSPNFPVPLSIMRALISFEEIGPESAVTIGDARVTMTHLNHPNGCLGIRIERGGRAVVYATDTEHYPNGAIDPNLLALARGADALIYDAMYTDEEYKTRVGWGHSTFSEGIRLAAAAGVHQLLFFHHDPEHDDDFLDRQLAHHRESARAVGVQAEMAREGLVVEL